MNILQTTDLKKYYGTEPTVTKALDGVTLSIEQGEFVAVVGTSGSGKSTLLHMMGGLDTPTSGSVKIRDRELSGMSREQLTIFRRRNIGFIFQSYNLIPILSVQENIVLPVELDGDTVDRTFMDEVIRMLGLERKRKAMPNNLSGGQQQRVAIARALITKPKLVFADEPTGNLDSVSSAEVLGFLKRSVNELGQTIVMVTHDAVAASYADRAIVFSDGRIVADEQHPNAEVMNELLMAERERTTRTTLTDTPADQMAQMAGVRNVPDLPITDAPLPPAVPTSGCEGTLRHARAAARHAR